MVDSFLLIEVLVRFFLTYFLGYSMACWLVRFCRDVRCWWTADECCWVIDVFLLFRATLFLTDISISCGTVPPVRLPTDAIEPTLC